MRTCGERGHLSWQASCILLGSALSNSSWVVTSKWRWWIFELGDEIWKMNYSTWHERGTKKISWIFSLSQACNGKTEGGWHQFQAVSNSYFLKSEYYHCLISDATIIKNTQSLVNKLQSSFFYIRPLCEKGKLLVIIIQSSKFMGHCMRKACASKTAF